MAASGQQLRPDVIVVGGGPAGLIAAIALADADVATVLVGKRTAADHRTTALLAGSVDTLESLGVWNSCRPNAAPLRAMRIIDDTSRLIRAPEVKFEADEIGLEAFGYNIENHHLLAALNARADKLANLIRLEDEVTDLEPGHQHAVVRLKDGQVITAQLVVGADGGQSLCRRAVGIDVDKRHYPQTALTFNLRHARPHNDISTEFHTESGPFTLVPLPGQRSSVVCVVDPGQAQHLGSLDNDELALELERRAHSILGRFEVEPGRGVFPLAMATAREFAARRVALVGEAAHLIPPIGAQGLNLGLRDAQTIGQLAVSAKQQGDDLGEPELLKRYDAARRTDIKSRAFAVDLLNQSLLSAFLPVQGARGLGLYLIERVGPLRRALMHEGVAPTLFQTRMKRGKHS